MENEKSLVLDGNSDIGTYLIKLIDFSSGLTRSKKNKSGISSNFIST